MKGKSHNNNWITELQMSTNGKSVDLQKYNISFLEVLEIIQTEGEFKYYIFSG